MNELCLRIQPPDGTSGIYANISARIPDTGHSTLILTMDAVELSLGSPFPQDVPIKGMVRDILSKIAGELDGGSE